MAGIKMGYLPQEPALDPEKTVRETVEEGMGEVMQAQAKPVSYTHLSSTRALQHCRVKATQAPCRWLHRPLRRANERRAFYKFS